MWREMEADGVRVWARTDLDEVIPRQAESCELVAGGGDLQSLALHLVHPLEAHKPDADTVVCRIFGEVYSVLLHFFLDLNLAIVEID